MHVITRNATRYFSDCTFEDALQLSLTLNRDFAFFYYSLFIVTTEKLLHLPEGIYKIKTVVNVLAELQLRYVSEKHPFKAEPLQ